MLPPLLPQLSGAPSAAPPVGAAGRSRERLDSPGSWSGRSCAAAQRSKKRCPRAEFWTNPFQGMHGKVQRDNRADPRRGPGPFCGDSPAPSEQILPGAHGMPRAAGEGGHWDTGGHCQSHIQIFPLRRFFAPGRLFHSLPVQTGTSWFGLADLWRGDLFKDAFSDAETLFISDLQHCVKRFLMEHRKDIQISILPFGLASLCIIVVLHCLVLKASVHCAWDLPQCCLQRWPTPFHPCPPHCAQLPPLEQTGCFSRLGQFWIPSAHQSRHVYFPT